MSPCTGHTDRIGDSPMLAVHNVMINCRWESLTRTVSRPFPRPATGKIAVKVIRPRSSGSFASR